MICEFSEIKDGMVCIHCGKPAKYRGRPVARVCDARQEIEPCQHRGESLRIEKCKPCQSRGVEVQIFGCAVHGECTLNNISKRKPDGSRWPACSTCEQRGA